MGNQQNASSEKLSVEQFTENLNKKKYQKIVVLTGAGISTNAGIPDFRSKTTGLYARLKEKGQFNDPQEIFSLKYFASNHKPFYEICRQYMNKEYEPQQAHKFISWLAAKKILLKNITQNIDGLELKAGLPKNLLIQAHGNLDCCYCIECHNQFGIDEFKAAVSASDEPFLCSCKGKIKPSVIFFGEALPQEFFEATALMKNADCVIVMGTSLMVQPFASIIQLVSPNVPTILFNNDSLSIQPSLFIQGDIDQNLTKLMNKLDK